jgi:hypothetical protein
VGPVRHVQPGFGGDRGLLDANVALLAGGVRKATLLSLERARWPWCGGLNAGRHGCRGGLLGTRLLVINRIWLLFYRRVAAVRFC